MELSAPSEILVDTPTGEGPIGVTVGPRGESCVTTEEKVSLFDSLNTLLASWASPSSGGAFTHPSVCDSVDTSAASPCSIWAIQGSTQLLCWKTTDASLSKVKKATLHCAAHSLLLTSVCSKESLDQSHDQQQSTSKVEYSPIVLPVVVIIHVNGDVSAFHGASLTLLASWTSALNTTSKSINNDGLGLPLWCHVEGDQFSVADLTREAAAAAAAAGNTNNQNSRQQPKLSKNAKELLELELKDDLTFKNSGDGASFSSISSSNNGLGGATLFVLQQNSSQQQQTTQSVVMNVFNLNSLSNKSPNSSNSRLSLDRVAVHHFNPPSTTTNSSVAVASFSSPTLSLLWNQSGGGDDAAPQDNVLQCFRFPVYQTSSNRPSFSKTPLLSLERTVGSKTPSSLNKYQLSAMGSSHVALLSHGDKKVSVAIVDVVYGTVLCDKFISTESSSVSRYRILGTPTLSTDKAQYNPNITTLSTSVNGVTSASTASPTNELYGTLLIHTTATAAGPVSDAKKKKTPKKAASTPSSSTTIHHLRLSNSLVQPVGSLAASLGLNVVPNSWLLAPTSSKSLTSNLSVPINQSLAFFQGKGNKRSLEQDGSSVVSMSEHGSFAPSEASWKSAVIEPHSAVVESLLAQLEKLSTSVSNTSSTSAVVSSKKKKSTTSIQSSGELNEWCATFEDIYVQCLTHFGINSVAKKTKKTDKRKESSGGAKSLNASTSPIYIMSSLQRNASIIQMNDKVIMSLVTSLVLLSNHSAAAENEETRLRLFKLTELCLGDLMASKRISGRQAFPLSQHETSQLWVKTSSVSEGSRLIPILVTMGNWRLIEQAVIQLPDLPEVDTIMLVREVLVGLNDAEITKTLHLSQSLSCDYDKNSKENEDNLALVSAEKKQKKNKRKGGSQENEDENQTSPQAQRIKIAERILCCAMLRGQHTSAVQNTKSFLFVSTNHRAKKVKRNSPTLSSSQRGGDASASVGFLRNAATEFSGQECLTLLYLLLNIATRIQRGENYLCLNNSKEELLRVVLENKRSFFYQNGFDFLLPLPGMESVADWVSAIIDSNFTNLVFQGMSNSGVYTHCLESLSQVIGSTLTSMELLSETKCRASSVMISSYRKTAAHMNKLQGGSDGDGGATIGDYSLEELCV